jgi:hypothetical protein
MTAHTNFGLAYSIGAEKKFKSLVLFNTVFSLGYKKMFWLVKVGSVPVSVKFFCPNFPSSADIKVSLQD